jgi:hypothetical protein
MRVRAIFTVVAAPGANKLRSPLSVNTYLVYDNPFYLISYSNKNTNEYFMILQKQISE